MTGFGNPLFGGKGVLKTRAIQSPDYVSGVSGWMIGDDGNAEFNELTIRGKKAYSESAGITAGQLVGNNINRQLGNLGIAKSVNDYGVCWNLTTGVWTCPTTDNYLITFQVNFTTWVPGSRMVLLVYVNGGPRSVVDATLGGGSGFNTMTVQLFLSQNDALTFLVYQNTGSTQTLDTFGNWVIISKTPPT